MISLWISNLILLIALGYLLWKFHRLANAYDELAKEQIKTMLEASMMRSALEFYGHLGKTNQIPVFNGEVANKALKGELH